MKGAKSAISDCQSSSVLQVKVIKMLVTVVVVFTFSWLPLYVVHLRLYYGPQVQPSSLEFSLLVQVSRSLARSFTASRGPSAITDLRLWTA